MYRELGALVAGKAAALENALAQTDKPTNTVRLASNGLRRKHRKHRNHGKHAVYEWG